MSSAESYAPTAPTHYVWWFPGSPVKVHLHLQVVQRLREQLRESGPVAIRQEGLLFGRTVDGVTEIFDLQPAAGRGIAEMLAAPAKEHGKRALMGYYRTEPGDLLRLNDNDRSLAERFFPKPHQVFLVIQSPDFGPPNATFFFHDDDHRMADFAFLEFPLDASLLTLEERDRMRRSQVSTTAAQPLQIQPAALPFPAPDPPRRHPVRRAAAWITAAVLILAAGVAIGESSFRERFSRAWVTVVNPAPAPLSKPSPPGISMGLRAQRQNGDLELTWNRESALIAAARSGGISIEDGGSKRQIPLNATQVHGGSLLYSPVGDQIMMQLTVETPEITATETVMVVFPKHGAAPQTIPVASTKAPAASQDPEAGEVVPRPKPSRPFTAPPAQIAARSVLPLTDDLPALSLPTANPPSAIASLEAPLVPTPPALRPNTSAPGEVASASATSRYQPPVAVSKPLPRSPSILEAWAGRPKAIEVRVFIDKEGKVNRTEPVPQSGIAKIFFDEAVKAARLWKFQPARLGGQPVASEVVLRFLFTR